MNIIINVKGEEEMSRKMNMSFDELKEFYINVSKKAEQRTNEYLNKLEFTNISTGEVKKINYTLQNKYKQDYLYYKGIADYINILATLKGYIPVFLTLTLSSPYHFFKKAKSGKIIKNKKTKEKNVFEINKLIREGYKLLNKVFREIIRQGQRKDFEIKTMYIKIIEAHKSFTPHLHSIVFVQSRELEKFIKVIKNKIKLYKLGKQHKIEILRDKEKGSAYILKYLQKTLKTEKIESLYVMDGWKKVNKIRLFTHSQVGLDRLSFNKIINHFLSKTFNKYNKDLKTEIKKDYYENGEWINPYSELTKRTRRVEVEDELRYFILTYKNILFKTAINIAKNKEVEYLVIRKVKKTRKEKWETVYLLKNFIKKTFNILEKTEEKIFETYKSLNYQKIRRYALCGIFDSFAKHIKCGLQEDIMKLIKLDREKYDYLTKYLETLEREAISSEIYNELMSLYSIPFSPTNKFRKFLYEKELKYFIKKINKLKNLLNQFLFNVSIILSEFKNVKITEKQIILNFEDDEIYNSIKIEVVKVA